MKKHWYDLNKFMFFLICLLIEIYMQVIKIFPSYVFLKLLSNNFYNLKTYFKVGLIFVIFYSEKDMFLLPLALLPELSLVPICMYCYICSE